MNYDDIFGEEIYDEGVSNLEKDFENLAVIFEKNGFDKQLEDLQDFCIELTGATSIFDNSKTLSNMIELVKSMAIVHTIIESFIASDDEIFDIVEEVRKGYIENELGKEDSIKALNNNRISYLLKNKTV